MNSAAEQPVQRRETLPSRSDGSGLMPAWLAGWLAGWLNASLAGGLPDRLPSWVPAPRELPGYDISGRAPVGHRRRRPRRRSGLSPLHLRSTDDGRSRRRSCPHAARHILTTFIPSLTSKVTSVISKKLGSAVFLRCAALMVIWPQAFVIHNLGREQCGITLGF